jgi:hypothetical protein
MRYNHVSCEACEGYLDTWAADALKNGWKLVQKVNDHNGLYRHLLKPDGANCGAKKQVHTSAMKRGKVLCDECEKPILEWMASAAKYGWELVRALRDNLVEYRHLMKPDGSPCGHLEMRRLRKIPSVSTPPGPPEAAG